MPPSVRSPQPAKAVLVSRDISQTKLAHDLGLSKKCVSDYLNGRERPSASFRRKLAEYLGLDAELLFDDGPGDVVVQLVLRTTTASGVPERVEGAAAERVGALLREAP